MMIKLGALLLVSACLLACAAPSTRSLRNPADQAAAAPGARPQASYCMDNPQACLNKP